MILQVHAKLTESYLNGKNLFDAKVLQTALQTLQSELKLDLVLPAASLEYRKNLACALLYKVLRWITNVLRYIPCVFFLNLAKHINGSDVNINLYVF